MPVLLVLSLICLVALGLAYSRALCRALVAERGRDDLSVAEESAHLRMRELCRDALSAATDGKLTLCFEPSEVPHDGESGREAYPLTEASLSAVRARARDLACGDGFTDGRVAALVQCVGEATMNAVRHGVGGVLVLGKVEGGIFCEVRDSGPGIPLELLPFAVLRKGWSTARSAGLGFFLMAAESDSMALLSTPGGTVVRMVVLRSDPDPLDYLALADVSL